ncbi:lytic murein transglycosylase [Blastococcus haudaquaticus]|uniref:Transglycosylase SLT domain-containing protein n=1 Tax=Blastococcus haudaquaticus TaxID=1938745 RepID=A0A286H375_9ACTN|nr:lytic murein transglycosylase [Blastococcus haudaquaticus]SOE02235.1 Transglycosylase SLT domain-containing protein [Blastococcus haudaquaticus]
MTPAGRDPARSVLLTAGGIGLAVAVGAGVVLLTEGGPQSRSRPAVEAPQVVLPDAEAAAGAPADASPGVPAAAWVREAASRTGVPDRAMQAYATAALALADEEPGCGLGWNTLAAIGQVESVHGTIAGGALGADGVAKPAIVGIPLDGDGVASIPDTDGGRLDGDRTWDRAVGPMQFIPSTWERWAADGDGDGAADPQDVDDAALAAARYLCSGGGSLATAEGWTAAVTSYNNSLEYAAQVAGIASRHASDLG